MLNLRKKVDYLVIYIGAKKTFYYDVLEILYKFRAKI